MLQQNSGRKQHQSTVPACNNYYTLKYYNFKYNLERPTRPLCKLHKELPALEKSLFNSLHAVETDTFPGWKENGEKHLFTEWYG